MKLPVYMKKSCNKVLLTAVIVLLAASNLAAQQTVTKRYMVVRSTPKYTLQLDLHYNQSILELSGTYNDDYQSVNVYNGQTMGADKGYGGGITSKISLDKWGSTRFTQSLYYNRLLSYTFGDKTTVADDGKATYNCFTGGLGLEYNFTPTHRFKIYLGGEINASMINGDIKIWFENRGNPEGPSDSSYTVNNSFRMGYGLLIGTEYLVNDKFGLNLGAKLTNANILFKQAEGTNADKEFPLRDDDQPGLNFAGKKNFAFYTIFAGVNFYFGVTEKRYKLN